MLLRVCSWMRNYSWKGIFSLNFPEKFQRIFTTANSIQCEKIIVREGFTAQIEFWWAFIDVITALFCIMRKGRNIPLWWNLCESLLNNSAFWFIYEGIIGQRIDYRFHSPVFTWYFSVVAQSMISCCNGTGCSVISKSINFFISSGWWKSRIFSFLSLQAFT